MVDLRHGLYNMICASSFPSLSGGNARICFDRGPIRVHLVYRGFREVSRFVIASTWHEASFLSANGGSIEVSHDSTRLPIPNAA